MKPKLKLYNSSFAHAISVGNGDLPVHSKYFEWDRTGDGYHTCIITEEMFHLIDNMPEARKIGWIIEPNSVNPEAYHWISSPSNYNKFDFIMTHNQALIAMNPDKFIYQGLFGTWLHDHEWQIYPKSKAISIIASDKKFTEGHRLRWEVINRFRDKMDVYGRGHNTIDSKLQGLSDYEYQVVIENEQSDQWVTEKLIDCLLSGVVPIYWGCKTITDIFPGIGIIQVNNLQEIETWLLKLKYAHTSYYKILMPAISRNFQAAQNFVNTEDIMFENILKPKNIL